MGMFKKIREKIKSKRQRPKFDIDAYIDALPAKPSSEPLKQASVKQNIVFTNEQYKTFTENMPNAYLKNLYERKIKTAKRRQLGKGTLAAFDSMLGAYGPKHATEYIQKKFKRQKASSREESLPVMREATLRLARAGANEDLVNKMDNAYGLSEQVAALKQKYAGKIYGLKIGITNGKLLVKHKTRPGLNLRLTTYGIKSLGELDSHLQKLESDSKNQDMFLYGGSWMKNTKKAIDDPEENEWDKKISGTVPNGGIVLNEELLEMSSKLPEGSDELLYGIVKASSEYGKVEDIASAVVNIEGKSYRLAFDSEGRVYASPELMTDHIAAVAASPELSTIDVKDAKKYKGVIIKKSGEHFKAIDSKESN